MTQSTREVKRRYHQSPKGRATAHRARQAYEQHHPGRYAVHAAVAYALRVGNITRLPCAVCGEEKVHAHHHLGYAREHRLDVVWLCDPHHKQAHEVKV